MTSLTLFDSVTLEDAAEGPMGLRVWPAEALEPTLRAYHKRLMCENGYKGRPDGSIGPYNRHTAGVHHIGRRKGPAVFKEGIDQTGNRGKR